MKKYASITIKAPTCNKNITIDITDCAGITEIFDKTIRLSIPQIIRVILIAIGLTLKTDIPVSSDMIHPFKPVISIVQIINYRIYHK